MHFLQPRNSTLFAVITTYHVTKKIKMRINGKTGTHISRYGYFSHWFKPIKEKKQIPETSKFIILTECKMQSISSTSEVADLVRKATFPANITLLEAFSYFNSLFGLFSPLFRASSFVAWIIISRLICMPRKSYFAPNFLPREELWVRFQTFPFYDCRVSE